MQEHRKYIRHPAEIPIEFATASVSGPAAGQTQDVSLGGLAFEADRCPQPGELVEVRIPVVEPSFAVRGRVVWCRSRNGGYEVGVQFTSPSDAFRARMVEQVCHIESYRREIREREGRELAGDAAAQEWIRRFAAEFPDPRGSRSEESDPD